ncbi:MAG: signal recognition particle subunit SRP19/SEC65 family protein [Nitrososphaerota archaeon]
MIRREGYIIWTTYFESGLSRAEGRRVPLKLAVKNPSQEMLLKSLQKLGWQYELLAKSHPRAWWKKNSSILIKPPKDVKKSQALKLIAQNLWDRR